MTRGAEGRIRTDGRRSLPLTGLLCLSLLFAQSAGLAHGHEGDLQPDYDCEICLKAGAGDDAAVAARAAIRPTPADQPSAPDSTGISSAASLAAKPRGPPAV